jgi:D-aspartate ligase
MAEDKNPLRAQRGWPPAVIAGGYQTGVNLMRILRRRGVTPYCVENDRQKQAFRTVYGKTFECPDPDSKPDEWLEFMMGLAQRLGAKPVLIPTGDAFVSAVAKNARKLSEAYIFCRETAPLQGMLATKEHLYDLATQHGMTIPRTRFVKSIDEATQFGSGARFPCLIKPVRSRDWSNVPRGHELANRKVMVANSPGELDQKYRVAAAVNSEVVIQETIEGPDNQKFVYLSCYGIDGRRLGSCIVRELRTAPIYNGNASVVVPVLDEEIDAMCDGFLKSLGYKGLCEIELKRDSRDGKVRMIEINPRFTGTSDAAPHAGIDLGWLHYLDLIGQHVEPVSQNNKDFRHVALAWDFSTIGSYRRAGLLTWGDVLRAYRPPVAFYDFDLRDWRVTLGTLITLAYLVVGRPIRRFFSGKPAIRN